MRPALPVAHLARIEPEEGLADPRAADQRGGQQQRDPARGAEKGFAHCRGLRASSSAWRPWRPGRAALRSARPKPAFPIASRSEEHTSELQSLMRNSYAVFCLKKKTTTNANIHNRIHYTCI